MPKWAAHSFVAFARMVSNSGSSLLGELDMTRSTSAVAVCCSSDSVRSAVRSRSSFNNRAFSMAITAWAAKFLTSSICLAVKGRTSCR